jgi:dethiobiotin synthetase
MSMFNGLAEGCFVTGTDTGVGKTYFSVRLIRALRRSGINACGFKPVCCGERDDVIALARASEFVGNLELINPAWLSEAVAPLSARFLGNEQTVEFAAIMDAFLKLRSQFPCVVVEGAGGWLVPLTQQQTMEGLAQGFGLPVVLVVRNRLGALNHALLTLRAVQSARLLFAGWALNTVAEDGDDPAIRTNALALKALLPGTNYSEFLEH